MHGFDFSLHVCLERTCVYQHDIFKIETKDEASASVFLLVVAVVVLVGFLGVFCLYITT